MPSRDRAVAWFELWRDFGVRRRPCRADILSLARVFLRGSQEGIGVIVALSHLTAKTIRDVLWEVDHVAEQRRRA